MKLDKEKEKSKERDFITLQAKITLSYSYCKGEQNLEQVPLLVKSNLNDERKNLYFTINDLTNEINLNLGNKMNLKDKAISYYDNVLNVYIYCGIFPIKNQIIIPINQIIRENLENKIEEELIEVLKKQKIDIKLKVRNIQSKLNLLKMELIEENQTNLDEHNQNQNISSEAKRSKERKIGYVIEKVFLWRKLYNGFTDDSGTFVKLTLEEAAERVGIAKKSLDDYLIQLRIGKSNGFNFNEHKNDKVGVLRSFVRRQKSIIDTKSQTQFNLGLNEDDENS